MPRVKFLINSGYGRENGHTPQQHEAFVKETTALFEKDGWKVFPPKVTGKYPTAVKGENRLYLHHFFLVGQIADEMVAAVKELVKEALTFGLYDMVFDDEKRENLCYPSLSI